LAAGSWVADGISEQTVIITINDVNGNLCDGYTGVLDLRISGEGTWSSGSVGATLVALTNGIGITKVRSTTKTGQVTVSAAVTSGAGLTSNPAQLQSVAGPATKLVVTLDKQNIKSNNSDEVGFSVSIRDYYDNILNTADNSVQLIVDSYGMIVTTAGITTNTITVNAVNGQVTGLKLRSGTQSGVMTISAVSSGLSAASNQVVLSADTAKKLAVSITGVGRLVADNVSSTTVTVMVQDEFGNLVTWPDYSVNLNLSGPAEWLSGGTAGKTLQTITGQLVVPIKSRFVSGTVIITASVNGLDGSQVTLPVSAKAATRLMLNADPPVMIADGQAKSTIHAYIVDQDSNIVTSRTDSVTFQIGNNYIVKPGLDGQSSVMVQSGVTAGLIHVTAQVAGLIGNSIDVETIPGSAARLSAVLTQAEIIADGASTTTVITDVVDVNGNKVDYSGELTITTIGPVQEAKQTGLFSNGTSRFNLTSQKTAGIVTVKTNNSQLGEQLLLFITKPKQVKKISLLTFNTQLVSDGQNSTVVQANSLDIDGNYVNDSTNTVRFSITGGAATWSDGSVFPQLIPFFSGTAIISVRSTVQAGTVRVTAGLVDWSGNVISTATIEIKTSPQSEPKKLVVVSEGNELTANGSEMTVRAWLADTNYNKISTGDNLVKFTVDGQADIISGTEPVKTVYQNCMSGESQIRIKSSLVTGDITVTVESSGLDVTSVTIKNVADVPDRIIVTADDAILESNGETTTRVNAVVIDANNNVISGYIDPVLFTVTGPGLVITSSRVVPVSGITDVLIRTKIESGTITVTAMSPGVPNPGIIKILSVTSMAKGIMLVPSANTVHSGEPVTLTIKIVDSGGILVPAAKQVELSVTAGNLDRQLVATLEDGTTQVVFIGTTAGEQTVTAVSGILTGSTKVSVLPSSISSGLIITVSTPVFVPKNVAVSVETVDGYNNKLTDTTRRITVEPISGPEVITSTAGMLVNGLAVINLYLKIPGVYEFKVSDAGVSTKTVTVYALLDKSKDNRINTKTDNGTIELIIPKDTFDKPLIIEMTKPFDPGTLSAAGYPQTDDNETIRQQTTVLLRARDGTGTEISANFAIGKYITLSLPYLDKGKPFSIVDGTNIREQNMRVWQYLFGKWALVENSAVDPDKNNVTVQVNQLGYYSLMSISVDPTVDNLAVYPNPFNDMGTRFMFNIGSDCDLKIEVYTITGRLVKTLARQVTPAEVGYIEMPYTGTDSSDKQLANGTYLYKMTTKRADKIVVKFGKFTKIN
jgi:adhesin/invasin